MSVKEVASLSQNSSTNKCDHLMPKEELDKFNTDLNAAYRSSPHLEIDLLVLPPQMEKSNIVSSVSSQRYSGRRRYSQYIRTLIPFRIQRPKYYGNH